MAETTILIIDDEELIRKVLDVKLKSLDYNTLLAKDSLEAFKHLEKHKVDIIFCDVFLPGMNGFEILKEIKKKYKDQIITIIMTAYANLKTAVKAFEYGAFDYLIKPFTMEEIPYILNKALKFKKLLNASKKTGNEKSSRFSEIIGVSDYILDLKKQLNSIISEPSPCLISGESGTGKKYIAKVIANHFTSHKKDDFYYANLLSFNKNKEQLVDTIFNQDFIKLYKTNIVIIDN
ncbi:MAG: response regulator, partial [Spirochaetes bacterium]|nr:response regulator [Spirochaetota bacterium]